MTTSSDLVVRTEVRWDEKALKFWRSLERQAVRWDAASRRRHQRSRYIAKGGIRK